MQKETWLDSKRLYEGQVVSLRVGHVELEDGAVALREVVEHPGGVAIVPVLGDSVLLIRQYRIAIGRDIIEVPAGKLEGAEPVETRARCELEEETGYRADTWIPLPPIYASVGYTSEKIHMFLALDLEKTVQRLEADERIEIVPVSLTGLPQRLAQGEFEDAKTCVGLHALLAYLTAHPEVRAPGE
jgi:8-oxo-dGTP pyrophosphatase MutT (NUDIX family)